jgi:hypothetical protein
MSATSTIFQQFLSLVPRYHFDRSVEKFDGNRYIKTFSCWGQFFANLYAQVALKASLRDIEIGLRSQQAKWGHLGISKIARSTLADANRNRDYRIYETLFYKTLARCKDITPKHKFRFKNPLFTLDATMVDMCLSLFPWAKYKYRQRKGAIKMHCLLDHRGDLPSFVVITEGQHNDVKVAKNLELPLLPDSILAIDRGYLDFEWLWGLGLRGVFFVTRLKNNIRYVVTGQQEKLTGKGILADETIQLTGVFAPRKYPEALRLVTFYDAEEDKTLRFLTNNFALAASTIAGIYKARWTVETFFKWIKQHLKIKTFLGTSRNAVLTQIWTAMIHYLLLAYVKYQTKYRYSLLEFSRMIQAALFERIPLIDLLSLQSSGLRKLKPAWEQLTFT